LACFIWKRREDFNRADENASAHSMASDITSPGANPARIRSSARGRAASLCAMLVVANVGAWAWAFAAFHHHPVLLGTALLAYSFGLRHAVDADHIAAIDNVTRKLMQQDKRPVAAGLFFSLGHSTIVFGLSVLIAFTSVTIKSHFASFASVGSVIGTSISAFFLFAIALANVIVLLSVYRTFRQVRKGARVSDESLDLILGSSGFFARIFRGLFGLIQHGWQMYFVGFLFGLGFDTATEVGLLGISATEATQGLSVWSILVFPTLFAAGMALVDSTVNLLMLSAYGWAFVKPVRKLYYNMTITLVSVLVALLVGGVEVLGLISERLNFHGRIWDAIGILSNHFGIVGFAIIGVSAAGWIGSLIYYKMNRYDEIDVKIDPVS